MGGEGGGPTCPGGRALGTSQGSQACLEQRIERRLCGRCSSLGSHSGLSRNSWKQGQAVRVGVHAGLYFELKPILLSPSSPPPARLQMPTLRPRPGFRCLIPGRLQLPWPLQPLQPGSSFSSPSTQGNAGSQGHKELDRATAQGRDALPAPNMTCPASSLSPGSPGQAKPQGQPGVPKPRLTCLAQFMLHLLCHPSLRGDPPDLTRSGWGPTAHTDHRFTRALFPSVPPHRAGRWWRGGALGLPAHSHFLWGFRNPGSQGSHSHLQMPSPKGTNDCHLPSTLGGGAVNEAGHGEGDRLPSGDRPQSEKKTLLGIQAVT